MESHQPDPSEHSFHQAEALRELKPDDQERAGETVRSFDASIADPFARFNLNMDGNNPEFVPKDPSLPREFAPPVSPELSSELSHPRTVELASGQRLNAVTANWQQLEGQELKRAIVYLPPYGYGTNDKGILYRVQELARQTGRPVVALNHPGMSGSDALTKEQTRGLISAGFGTVAEAELEALSRLGLTDVDLVGTSMGAFAAASLAEKAEAQGLKVHNLIMAEAPGVKDQSPVQLGRSFMGEGQYLPLLESALYDPELRAISEANKSKLRQLANTVKFAVNIPVIDRRLGYARAMANGSIEDTLNAALANNPDLEVSIIHGTLSTISPDEANGRVIRAIKAQHGNRIKETIYPGEPHIVMEFAKRFAAEVKRILN